MLVCTGACACMCIKITQHMTAWSHTKAVCVTCNVIRPRSNRSILKLKRIWKWSKKTLKQLQLFWNHKPTVNPTIVSLQLKRAYKLTFTCSMIWQKKWLTQYVRLLHHYHRWFSTDFLICEVYSAHTTKSLLPVPHHVPQYR